MLKLIPHRFQLSQLSGSFSNSVRKVSVRFAIPASQDNSAGQQQQQRKYSAHAVARRNNLVFRTLITSFRSIHVGNVAMTQNSDDGSENNDDAKSLKSRLISGRWKLIEYQAQRVDKIRREYEAVRLSHLKSWQLKYTETSVLVACDDQTFPIAFKVDLDDPALVLINRADIRKAISVHEDKHHKFARLFRERSMVKRYGEAADEQYLVAAAADGLLRFYGEKASAAAARETLIHHGLISLEPAVPLRQATLNEILARVQEHFPDLEFVRNARIVVADSKTRRRRHRLDVWCEELKLSIECDEESSFESFYAKSFRTEQEADIRKAKGDDVSFYRFNPHAKGFDLKATTSRIVELIAVLSKQEPIKCEPVTPPTPASADAAEFKVGSERMRELRNELDKEMILLAEILRTDTTGPRMATGKRRQPRTHASNGAAAESQPEQINANAPLSFRRVASMLSHYRATKPELVEAVLNALMAAGLVSK